MSATSSADGRTPCSASEAVIRALSLVGNGGQYILGTGDYLGEGKPPWTYRDKMLGSDCAGFAICWAYKLKRHRPGFNRGKWSTVSDDINCNSALEDAQHKQELFVLADRPEPGVLLVYPTFTVSGKRFIGHVGIVTGLSRVAEWDPLRPQYELLDVAQCRGPNERKPAVVKTDGSLWSHHDAVWPKLQHRTWMIKARPWPLPPERAG
jgi:hypothetical protein